MNILVINAGSSSLKYQVTNMETEAVVAKGLCEKVGSPDAFHKLWYREGSNVISTPMPSHKEAIDAVFDALLNDPSSQLNSLDEIDGVGHRIVHGGEYFSESVLVDEDVIADIEECAAYAPLHNPPAVTCLRHCAELLPGIPQVVVFDTAFHQTMKPSAYMYALPYDFYSKYGIRKYGAHGTSHRYLAQRTAELMGKKPTDLKIITCHLGNGGSVTAIDHGQCVDTSMGFTPLAGVMMGTRCGDLDPAVVTYLMEREGWTPAQMNDIMNRESGLKGISGISNDLREVKQATIEGHERATLAYDMYSNSVKKYIGSYMAIMGGVDAIAFAGGVGEHCERMRRMILSGLEPLGIIVDQHANEVMYDERRISRDDSKIDVWVVPTNEEIMISRDTQALVNQVRAAEAMAGASDEEEVLA